MNNIERLLFKFPKICFVLGSILLSILSLSIVELKTNYEVRSWFSTTDPLVQRLDFFEELFGNDEVAIAILHAEEGFFSKESFLELDRLTKKMWQVTGVSSVESLANYTHIEAEGDDILIQPLVDQQKIDESDYLHQREKTALNDEVLSKHFISEDGRRAVVFARLTPSVFEKPDYQQIATELYKIANDYQATSYDLKLSGSGVLNDAFRKVSLGDVGKVMPMMIILVIIFMLVRFRSWLAVFFPLFLWTVVVFSTYSFAAIIGISFNNLTSIVPGVIMAVAIADSMHVLVSYFSFRAEKGDEIGAVQFSFQKNFFPTLLTSLSTAVGFLSLTMTDLKPIQELGILSGFATLLAWMVTIFMLFPLLIIFKPRRGGGRGLSRSVNQSLVTRESAARYYDFLLRYKKVISAILLFIGGLSLYWSQYLIVNSDPVGYLRRGLPVREATEYANKHFGGLHGPEAIVDSGVVGGAKDARFLEKLDEYINWVRDHQIVNTTSSLLDIIKPLNQALHEGNQSYYKIPDKNESIAELLFLYQMSLPQDKTLTEKISLDERYVRISILWPVLDSQTSLKYIRKFENKAEQMGLDVEYLGKLTLYHRMNEYIVGTFFKTLILSIVAISLLMIVILRSYGLGLMSMLPNILPLAFGAGLIGIVGLDVNIGTSIVAAICLGIAVDDTIHFLVHYVRNYKKHRSNREALIDLFYYTAPALMYTTLVLAVGFGLFVFSDFVPNIHFGLLCAYVLTWALIIDLVALPILLIFTDKKGDR